ncbi:MAG: hypothetical protein ACI92C_001274, partial [Neolewinella sp.]
PQVPDRMRAQREARFALPSGVKLRFTVIYIFNLDTGY